MNPERVRGGLRIWHPHDGTYSFCTSGFMVHTGLNTKMLTAGHCGSGSWYNGAFPAGDLIGSMTETMFYDYSDADAQVVGVLNSRESHWVYIATSITGLGFPVNGQPVCLLGQAIGGQRCGQITDKNDVTAYLGLHFVNQLKSDINSGAGDSGGPLYNVTQHAAYGINAAYNGTDSWYGRVDYILDQFNEDLCIENTCTN